MSLIGKRGLVVEPGSEGMVIFFFKSSENLFDRKNERKQREASDERRRTC